MKHMIACITAVTLLLGMSACAKNDEITEPSGATLEVELSHSYKSEKLPLDGYYFMEMLGDRMLLYKYLDEKETYSYALYDLNSGSLAEMEWEKRIDGAAYSGDTIELFYQVFSEEELKAHSYIVTCDSELNPISTEEVSDLWREVEAPSPRWGVDTLMLLFWTKDAEGNQYLGSNEGLWCLTTDSTLHQIEGVGASSKLFFDEQGRMYSVYFGQTPKIIDPETLKAEAVELDNLPKQDSNDGSYSSGNSTYDFTYSDGKSLFGVKLDAGITEELVNWEDSDFEGYEGMNYHLFPNGQILVSTYGNNYLLTARTQEEADAVQLISMVFPNPTRLSRNYLVDMAHKFNREHDGYRITIRNYGTDEDPDGSAELEADLLAGVIPDIIADIPNYNALSNKGLFEDLRMWMENDADFHQDEYLMNLFNSMTYQDRMEQIAFHFGIQTYMVKAEHLNGKDRLTLEELQAFELPEGMVFMPDSRNNQAVNLFFYYQLGNFIDFSSGTCSFDSPEFVQMLELFGSLPEQAPVEDEDIFKNDRALLYCPYTLSNLQGYHDEIVTYFGDAEVTLTGLPFNSSEGNGGVFVPKDTIVISSQSMYKEQIWEFIKFCLSEENQQNFDYERHSNMPVNLSALEGLFDISLEPYPGKTIDANGVEIPNTPATKEEADTLMEYVKGITVSACTNSQINTIAKEETGMYFSGDCTAQEAAERIQKRVNMYLAEQK